MYNHIIFYIDFFLCLSSEVKLVISVTMAPIKLPCLVGGDCNFETVVELEYDLATAQQDGHMQYAHGAAAGQGGAPKRPD